MPHSESADDYSDPDLRQNAPIIIVNPDQLPLYCPQPGSQLWCLHPRVFIAIKSGETKQCAYCGTSYRLEERQEEAQ